MSDWMIVEFFFLDKAMLKSLNLPDDNGVIQTISSRQCRRDTSHSAALFGVWQCRL
uniref:Uncharacterized protein n=1 Tax=Magallana gigas TaxID=29159 RepID=K1Q8R0_MAGGI